MGKEVKKNFNIGWNFLNAFLMAWTVTSLVYVVKDSFEISYLYISLPITILCSVIAFKKKFDYFWLYPLLILPLPIIGLTLFFYTLVKYSAKKNGKYVEPGDIKKILKEIGRFILIFIVSIILIIGSMFLGFDPCKISNIYANSSFCTNYLKCGYFCIFVGMFPLYVAPLIISACLWKNSNKWFIETILAILFINLIFFAGQSV